jgi:hypothetical protein
VRVCRCRSMTVERRLWRRSGGGGGRRWRRASGWEERLVVNDVVAGSRWSRWRTYPTTTCRVSNVWPRLDGQMGTATHLPGKLSTMH